MAKKKVTAKMVRELSEKSGFSASLIYMVFQMGIIGAYEFFNNVENIKTQTNEQ